MTLNVNFTFDEKSYRHYMNGFLSVLHCHHYLCLTTKTAMDFKEINGLQILQETAEDTMRPVFEEYFKKNDVTTVKDKLLVGMRYYAVMGLGKMKATANEQGGEVVLARSHVDQGWLKRWGRNSQPVNFFTRGYIAAMFAAAVGKPARSFAVHEMEAIATGNDYSRFKVHTNN